MSSVSNVIFAFSILENGLEGEEDTSYFNMEKINDWLNANHYGAFSVDADSIAGGTKHLETPLYVAAFNHFDVEAFCNFVRSLQWEHPDCVQIFIQQEEDEKFRLIEPCAVG